MLKYRDIIDKLTEEQKLALVTDLGALGEVHKELPEVPDVTSAELETIRAGMREEERLPSLFGMANSWDMPLIREAAGELTKSSLKIGHGLIETPKAQVKSGVYESGFSEDPFLCGMTAAAFASGIEQAGGTAVLCDMSVRNGDAAELDIKPDMRVVNDYLLSPFATALKYGKATAVKSTLKALKNEWRKINTQTVEKTARESFPKNVRLLYADAPQDTLMTSLLSPNVLFASTPITAVRAALKNYRRIKEDVEHGAVSVDELNTAFADGTAVSDEMLDAAVDKVLGFAAECKSKMRGAAEDSGAAERRRELSRKATRASTVLLKNEGVLPLKKGKVAVLGQTVHSLNGFAESFTSLLAEKKIRLLGFEDGYRTDADRSDDLIPAALALAAKADTVIIFLGLGADREAALEETRTLALPANQDALLSAVVEAKKTVVAIVVGDALPDMSFDVNCEGVMFVPGGAGRGGEALAEMLVGKFSPSGKLATSGYDDVDGRMTELKKNRDLKYNKVGPFVGYRHYLTAGEEVKYPFGFGLSYTEFTYSGLKTDINRGVTFTLKNSGKFRGSEVVQLYVQKVGSAVVRPHCELKGFAKVALAKGKKTTVNLPLNLADFAVFDNADSKPKIEGGVYKIMIGSSCDDIRLEGNITVEGGKLTPLGERLSDYLRSEPNVISGKHYLSKGKKKKDSSRPKVAQDFPYEKLFLDAFEQEDEDDDSAAAALDEEEDITRFISDKVTLKTLAHDLAMCMTANGFGMDIKTAVGLLSAMSASRLILLSTDSPETFAEFADNLTKFFASECVKASAADFGGAEDMLGKDENARTPVAAAIAQAGEDKSKVKTVALDGVVPAAMNGWFTPLMRYVCNPETDRVTFGGYGTREKTLKITPNIWFFMRVGTKDAAGIPAHIADIATLIPLETRKTAAHSDLTPAFTANYHQMTRLFEKAVERHEIAEDGWKRLDDYIMYTNKVLTASAKKHGKSEDEDGEDTLARSTFHIGNKMWLQMEKYVATFIAGGGSGTGALDSVLAVKLLPALAGLIRGKDENDIAATLEKYFGEDNTENSKAAAKRLGL